MNKHVRTPDSPGKHFHFEARAALQRWSTESELAAHAIDAWSEKLSENFLPWTLSETPRAPFSARIKSVASEDFTLIHCSCDENRGYRGRREIAASSQALFGVLCVLEGREVLRIGDQQVVLQAGNFLIWDSLDTMEYALAGGPMEKATIMVPQDKLLEAVPNLRALVGKRMGERIGIESIFADHLRSLTRSMDYLDTSQLAAVSGSTIDLLARTTHARLIGETDPKLLLLARVQRIIIDNLRDPELSPAKVARISNISLRYLHAVFEQSGTTVGRWIKDQRLKQCRRELMVPSEMRRSLTEIAMIWGFRDLSHFSHSFREKYGLSPSQFSKLIRLHS